MGLRDIERKMRSKSAYQRKEAEILLDELDDMIENLEVLKEQLKKFEKEHEEEIQDNEDYYKKIGQLRDELGLPKEIGVYEWKDSPSLKDKFTGGGFYNQLANDILDLGNTRARKTGGIISVAEIVLDINKSTPGKLVSPEDVLKAISKLEDNELIQGVRKLGSGVKVVEFIALELSDDQQRVLDLASRKEFLTKESILMDTSWSAERVDRILEEMEKQGLIIKEETMAEGNKYWFPGLSH